MEIIELKKFMKEQGITYEMLAKKAGISIGTVKYIFSGRTSNPRIDTMQAIEKALGIKEEPPTEVKGSDSTEFLRKYGLTEESVPVLDEVDIAKIKAYIQGLIDSKRNK